MSIWPDIPYQRFQPTAQALHMWLQIVGKFKLANTPWVNHSWHATFYVHHRGLSTGLVHCQGQSYEVLFDCVDHQLVIHGNAGKHATCPLGSMSVAEFHTMFLEMLGEVDAPTRFHGSPNEVPDPVPFVRQTTPLPYDKDAVHDFWRALSVMEPVFQTFRIAFLGKVSPMHLFWGSFDLACTRFSGRTAPPHPGGFPALPDDITREAYSHEVISAGFWPGGGPLDAPAFYAYAYPSPEGLADAPVLPDAAYYDPDFGEFILPYDAVRNADDPQATLLAFLQSTYDGAADLLNWDRAALECAIGQKGWVRAL